MKHRYTILTAGILLAVLAAIALAVGAGKSEPASAAKCNTFSQVLKDAKVEATNTRDGVTIRISGNTRESVKLIQAYWEECGKYHLLCLPCPCDSNGCHDDAGSGTTGGHQCGGCSHSGARQEQGCGGCH